MREAVIVEALRTPIARGKMGKGDLSGIHPATLLAKIAVRSGREGRLDPKDVEQVIAGCVTQAGEQSNNIARNAWLSAGKTFRTGGTTVDTQCGSSQQANHMMRALVAGGQHRRRYRMRRRGDEPRRSRRQRDPRSRFLPDGGLALGPGGDAVRRGRAHREEPRHHARRRRSPRARVAAEGGEGGRGGTLRSRDPADRGARARRRRRAHRQDAHRHQGPGSAPHDARRARRAEAGAAGRHAHGGQLVADQRRRGRRAVDDRREGEVARAAPARAHPPGRRGRHRSLLPARRPDRRHPGSCSARPA